MSEPLTPPAPHVLPKTLLAFFGGLAMLFFAVVLAREHVYAIQNLQGSVLPLAAQAAPLEHRLEMLKKQVEVARLDAAVRPGAPVEKLDTFVLPKEARVDHVLAYLDLVLGDLRTAAGARDVSPIELSGLEIVGVEGDPSVGSGTVVSYGSRAASLSLSVRADALPRLFLFLRLPGLLTVQDAFTHEEIEALFRLTEEENPTAVVNLGQFLSTDLLTYVAESKPHNDRFFAAFSDGEKLKKIQFLLNETSLHAFGELLRGPLGQDLQKRGLWPLPFLAVEHIGLSELPGGRTDVRLRLRTYQTSTGNTASRD